MKRHLPNSDLPVLVLESSSYYTALLRDWLADLGYKDIYVYGSIEKSRGIIFDQRFAALVIDSKLDDGSGIRFAREIRHAQKCPNRLTPMIVLDGRSTRRRVTAARDGGASEYVCKPMSRKSFIEHFQIAVRDQRSFIKSGAFFGPDRRRRPSGWDGTDRRQILPKKVPITDSVFEV